MVKMIKMHVDRKQISDSELLAIAQKKPSRKASIDKILKNRALLREKEALDKGEK